MRPVLLMGLLLVAQGAGAGTLTQATAEDLNGRLESLRGRVVLINFWATWCRPCLEEIPALQQLERDLGERGFTLVAVSLDDADTAADVVVPFMDKWFPDFDSLLSVEYEMDDMVSVVDPAWNEILPTSYIVGRDGRLAERIQGINTPQQFRERIVPLLD